MYLPTFVKFFSQLDKGEVQSANHFDWFFFILTHKQSCSIILPVLFCLEKPGPLGQDSLPFFISP